MPTCLHEPVQITSVCYKVDARNVMHASICVPCTYSSNSFSQATPNGSILLVLPYVSLHLPDKELAISEKKNVNLNFEKVLCMTYGITWISLVTRLKICSHIGCTPGIGYTMCVTFGCHGNRLEHTQWLEHNSRHKGRTQFLKIWHLNETGEKKIIVKLFLKCVRDIWIITA